MHPRLPTLVKSILDSATLFVLTPTDKTKLTGLVVSVTHGDKGISDEDKQKLKSRCTYSITSKYEVPNHYVSSQLGEFEGAGSINSSSIHDVFIATAKKTRE